MAIACAPCIANALAPAALGALGLSTLKNKKSQKGGSGYETQEEYDQMMNDFLERTYSYEKNERIKEEERKKAFEYQKQQMDEMLKKECSDLMKLIINKGDKQREKIYAKETFKHKQLCQQGVQRSCFFCKDEYLKNLVGERGSTVTTPPVPFEALPVTKSDPKMKSKKFRKKGSNLLRYVKTKPVLVELGKTPRLPQTFGGKRKSKRKTKTKSKSKRKTLKKNYYKKKSKKR
jgi:hypothetical protein